MIKVLVVEDSLVAQKFLVHVLSSDPKIQVVGTVSDGVDAVAAVRRTNPDVITMDIHMPRMNGYEATRAIMQMVPTPIVIVSASTGVVDATSSFRALDAGALAAVLRPRGIGNPHHAGDVQDLLRTIKAMSEVRVVRRFNRGQRNEEANVALASPSRAANGRTPGHIEIVVIGASTGGPPVLSRILSRMPPGLAAPILIVQHIAPGFGQGFVRWLNTVSCLPVHSGEHAQIAMPGHVYVAPDGVHMGVTHSRRILISDQPPDYGLRPSAAHLFRSVGQRMAPHALGILLTGMGKDGSAELADLRARGGQTVAQDEASSVVHGMPGEAIRLGGANFILDPESIADKIIELVGEEKENPRG